MASNTQRKYAFFFRWIWFHLVSQEDDVFLIAQKDKNHDGKV